MRKKENTRSARADKARRSAVDIGICFLCGTGIAFCLWLFFTDINKSLIRLDENPIALISFKHKAAQRRTSDRVLWDSLQQRSPVYSGDLIRTADFSEAVVHFPEGGEINLSENSLIQVFPERIELTQGDISLAADSKNIVVSFEGKKLDIAPGGLVNITAADGNFNLDVIKGNARLDFGSGFRTVSGGSAVAIDSRGNTIGGTYTVPLSPLPQTKYLVQKNTDVHFSWNTVNYREGEKTRFEIAEDRRFSKPFLSADIAGSETTVSLEEGKWWWRVYPAESKTMPSGISVLVINALPPLRISPPQDALIRYSAAPPEIRFVWSETQAASAYIVEVASDAAFTSPFIQTRVQSPFLHSRLSEGSWYWRVRPVFSGTFAGTVEDSEVSSFIVERTPEPARPVLDAPPDGSFFSILLERENAYFSWKRDPEASSYTIYVSQNADLSDPVIAGTVGQNYFMYGPRDTTLNTGVYYWGVTQTNSEGKTSPLSGIFSFTAGTNPPPVAAAEIPPSEEAPLSPAVPVPIPTPIPVPVPAPVYPPNGEVFGAEELLNRDGIEFSWNESAGAEAYIFTLYKTGPGNARREILRTRRRQASCFVLLRQLDTGTFLWQIEAVNTSGNVERNSTPGQSSFTIDISLPGEVKLYDPGPLYGN
ncbi:MAG: DUF4962 domain-containing protein [Treponema sp.]|jgi:hypothetical protein|nr:DUF4962 domain-containing protein [Treponema sp.]